MNKNFHLLYFIYEKACLYVHVIPNTSAKFRGNLRNLENRDAGKEA